MDALASALAYADEGWSVLPIVPGTKRPVGRHGLRSATTDTATIQGWWRRWPQAGVAVACAPSALAVLDVDPRNGGSEPALHWACDVPATRVVETPSGGVHLYFKHSGMGLRPHLDHVGLRGIDVKHEGYVVAPPTPGYWVRGDDEVASLSECTFLVEALSVVEPPQQASALPMPSVPSRPPTHSEAAWYAAALRGEVAAVAGARRGTRNDTLNRAAFRLSQLQAGAGWGPGTVERALWGAARYNGLAAEEPRATAATIRSGVTDGAAAPRRAPDPCAPARAIITELRSADDPAAVVDAVLMNGVVEELARHVGALRAEWAAGITDLVERGHEEAARRLLDAVLAACR